MTPRTDVYYAVTPFGAVAVEFPEDGGSVLTGEPAAVDYLKSIMARTTNSMGMTMEESSLEPFDFVNFCQPQGSGIMIIEPIDEVLQFGSILAVAESDPTLDSAGSPEELRTKLSELQDAMNMASLTPMQRMRMARAAMDLSSRLKSTDANAPLALVDIAQAATNLISETQEKPNGNEATQALETETQGSQAPGAETGLTILWRGKEMPIETAKAGLKTFIAMVQDSEKTIGEMKRSKKAGDPERARAMSVKLGERKTLVSDMTAAILASGYHLDAVTIPDDELEADDLDDAGVPDAVDEQVDDAVLDGAQPNLLTLDDIQKRAAIDRDLLAMGFIPPDGHIERTYGAGWKMGVARVAPVLDDASMNRAPAVDPTITALAAVAGRMASMVEAQNAAITAALNARPAPIEFTMKNEPMTVKVEQPASVVNITMPEPVQAPPAQVVVHVPEQAAPVVNITNEVPAAQVVVASPVRSVAEVQRDPVTLEILRTVTTHETE